MTYACGWWDTSRVGQLFLGQGCLNDMLKRAQYSHFWGILRNIKPFSAMLKSGISWSAGNDCNTTMHSKYTH